MIINEFGCHFSDNVASAAYILDKDLYSDCEAASECKWAITAKICCNYYSTCNVDYHIAPSPYDLNTC